MKKTIINTIQAPAPIGPYSQAVKVGNVYYLSGQIAIDPVSEKLVMGDLEEETRQVMSNIGAILSEAKLSFEHIVKTSIFLKNMDDFGKINAIYGEYFKDAFPARETVEVSGLPKGVNVEISVIAVSK